MIEPEKYFRPLFGSGKLSRMRFNAYCTDHIERLTANNPGGIFNSILADVTAAFDSYNAGFNEYHFWLAKKKGSTTRVREAYARLLTNLSDNWRLIAYTYRNDKQTLEEFYPLGVSEYYDATATGLLSLAQRFKNVLTLHAADFFPAFAADFEACLDAYASALDLATEARARLSTARSQMAEARPALAAQMTKNLLTLALHFFGNPSKHDVYFDQAMLDAAFRESARKVTADIDPGQTQCAFGKVTKGRVQIRMENTGEGPLHVAFGQLPAAPVPAEAFRLEPGQEVTLIASELGWTSGQKSLNISNHGTLQGSYEMEKV